MADPLIVFFLISGVTHGGITLFFVLSYFNVLTSCVPPINAEKAGSVKFQAIALFLIDLHYLVDIILIFLLPAYEELCKWMFRLAALVWMSLFSTNYWFYYVRMTFVEQLYEGIKHWKTLKKLIKLVVICYPLTLLFLFFLIDGLLVPIAGRNVCVQVTPAWVFQMLITFDTLFSVFMLLLFIYPLKRSVSNMGSFADTALIDGFEGVIKRTLVGGSVTIVTGFVSLNVVYISSGRSDASVLNMFYASQVAGVVMVMTMMLCAKKQWAHE